VFLSAALPGTRIPTGWALDPRFPTHALDDLLDRGADVFRSTWDRDNLLVHLDIDYLNADLLGHAFARPVDVFERIEPTYQALTRRLGRYGMAPLAVMTGRGYQWAGRIPLESPLVARLATVAPEMPDWYYTQNDRLPSWIRDRLTFTQARAHVGAGLVLEHLAHRLIQQAAPHSPLPIVLNGTNVGFGAGGREAVSIDLSSAGDPMDVRHMRVAFGGYQLHRFRPDAFGPEVPARRDAAPASIARRRCAPCRVQRRAHSNRDRRCRRAGGRL